MTMSSERPEATDRAAARDELERLVVQAEKVKQIALVYHVDALRRQGMSTRQIAAELGVSKSTVGRAMQIDPKGLPAVSDEVFSAARAFVQASAEMTSVDLPDGEVCPHATDVVVFDVMREALTSVDGLYVAMQLRAEADGEVEERAKVIADATALNERVDALDPFDRPAHIAMTRDLRELRASLEAQYDASRATAATGSPGEVDGTA